MKKLSIIFLTILFSVKILPQLVDSGLESIKSDELLRTVKILASAEFDGRLPGSEGYNKAANFASDRFAKIGLLPAGDEGFFQYLNVEYNKIDTPAVFNLIMNNKSYPYILGKDFVLRGFTGAGNLNLPVAFCGYGISRPDLGYDDYEKIDVRDKIVLVFKQNPTWKIEDQPWGSEYPREKSTIAYQHGAKGILFVSRPNDEKPQPLIGSVMHGDGEQIEDFPQLHISIDAANALLDGTGFSISEYQAKIDEARSPNSFISENQAQIMVKAHYQKQARTMNVIGLLEGSEPKLKDEYLILGAHLDHVGSQAGLLFPGANDNASGSVGILEIAEAFQSSDSNPKRSILFVLFASEEQGLFGSKFFVENLKIDTNKIIAMLNLDCIGYGDSIQIGNGKSSPELWKLADEIDEKNSNLIVKDTWSGGGADLTPVYEKGIPGLYFVSKHSYDYLHLPSDKPETLNPVLYENLVKLVY
ncbi:MAG: M20/M25/M40 family metallo-hydrolase, partial [Ignavibacteriaceae bacterium]|nr:M20/M25/M40 family metallo-hydrolase [Ignavibacteriaceae bacterium]